jgi:HSP20 family protein
MQQELNSLPVNLYRTADRVVVAVPMPGLQPEDVTIDVTATGCLVLQGRLRGALRDEWFVLGERWLESKEVLLDEWSAGGYYREVDLPDAVDGALATATYGNGVLVVALPLTDEIVPARLSLEAMGGGRGQRVGSAGHPVQPRE